MKKYKIISLLSFALILCSCEDIYVDKFNRQFSDEQVWSIAESTLGVLNETYTMIPHRPDSYDSNFLDAATDNAMTSYRDSYVTDLSSGGYSAYNNPLDCWDTDYLCIQYASLFMDNVMNDVLAFNPDNEDNNLGMRYGYKAEAFFIRAFYLFDLIQVYGGKSDSGEALGVPIINEYTTTDDAVDMLIDYKRNSYKDCVDQIMNDLDSAAYYFAMPNASAAYTIGRADAKIVEAFRSRVALYAASPAYQDDSVVKINGMGDFSVVNTDTYVDSWEEAAGITYESMVYNGVMAYRLLSSDLADASTSTPSEFIFRFYFNNRNLETGHFLPRYFGSSYTVPSQNLVDAFPMANGYPITHNDSGYDSNDPYVNRDSRFYLNIYYHGADYGESTYESEDLPLTKVDVLPGGLDSPTYGNSKNSYASQTGYYLAKFISKNFACNNPLSTTNVKHYCPEIRRVELLLNYAEAANEAWGPREYGSYVDGDNVSQTVAYSAYDIIKMIRAISLDGVSGGDGYLEEVADEGQDAFRELIYNERRLELAFENSRFFDLRRCLLDLTESVRGVSLTGSGEYDDDGNEIVAKYDTTVVVEERKYNGTHHYYLPLPYTEVVKGLENNMGW